MPRRFSCFRWLGVILPLLAIVVIIIIIIIPIPADASPRLEEAFPNEPLLLFPQSTVFQFTLGVSVPIASGKTGGLAFSYGFQFNYVLPWNVSQFEPWIVHARDSAATSAVADDTLSLKRVYESLEDLLERCGWKNGRACLLKTICELADTPIDRSGTDVVEEVVHLLLTPSENASNNNNSNNGSDIEVYAEAERLGKSRGRVGCDLAYTNCPESPLDSFTRFLD